MAGLEAVVDSTSRVRGFFGTQLIIAVSTQVPLALALRRVAGADATPSRSRRPASYQEARRLSRAVSSADWRRCASVRASAMASGAAPSQGRAE